MPRLFKTLALAAGTAGMMASALPVAAAPAFDSNGPAMFQDEAGSVNHSPDSWRERDRNRDRDRYRDNRNYGRHGYYGEPVRAETRTWRGRDGRYYCRRDDGTTGLLIGGAVGGLIGNEVAGSGDRTLGTILGVAGGALLGRAVDRSDSRCR